MSAGAWCAFLVAAGIGAPARYAVDVAVSARTRGSFPWGTVAVNISGCLVLGVLTGLGLYHHLGRTARVVLGTGGMGAYTTFSTFSFETARLVEEGDTNAAIANVAVSVVGGLVAAAAGIALAYAV